MRWQVALVVLLSGWLGIAHAQTPSGTPASAPPASTTDASRAGFNNGGDVSGKALVRAAVRNPAGESIGEVEEVVLSADGRVKNIIVSVGGFLGVGTKRVAMQWSDFRLWQDKDRLTLVTCFPFDDAIPGGPLRYVVVATRDAAPVHRIREGTMQEVQLGNWSAMPGVPAPERGARVAGMVGSHYGAPYVVLVSGDDALLRGSLLLFALVAGVMVAERRIDWCQAGADVLGEKPVRG